MSEIKTIYLENIWRGSKFWRPVLAIHIAGETYRIIGHKPEDEDWPFEVGDTVKIKMHTFETGDSVLLAYCKSS